MLDAATHWLLDLSLQGTLLLVLASAVSLLLRRASAAARHLVWVLALGGLLVLPLLGILVPRHMTLMRSVLPSQAMPVVPQAAPPPGSRAESRQAESSRAEVSASPQPIPLVSKGAVTENARDVDPRFGDGGARRGEGWAVGVLGVWLGGVLLVGARIVAGLLAVRRLERATEPLSKGPLVQRAQQARQALGCGRAVTLCLARADADVMMPLTWGWRSPVVLLPSGAPAWASNRQRMVLLHELGHIARGDWATLLVAQVACALYWFHPLAWMASRSLRAESERATDDQVLAAGVRAGEYGECLLEFVRLLPATPGRSVMKWTLAMACPSTLEKRVCALLDARRNRSGVSRLHLLGGLAAAVGVVSSVVRLGAFGVAPVRGATAATSAATNTPGLSKTADQQMQARGRDQNLTSLIGPGVVVHLRDNGRVPVDKTGFGQGVVHDYDLLQVVNELRASGALGIAINGVPVTSRSAIRAVGPRIRVGNQAINHPYSVEALGNPADMERALSASGGLLEGFRRHSGPLAQLERAARLQLTAERSTLSPRRSKATANRPSAPTQDRLFWIASGSMEPTLSLSSIVRVQKHPFESITEAQRGDIIVYTRKDEATGKVVEPIKRIVGLPGDRVKLSGTSVWVNGHQLPHAMFRRAGKIGIYQEKNGGAVYFVQYGDNRIPAPAFSTTVLPGHLLCLGDNRDNSFDSRYTGLVPMNSVIGKMVP